MADTVIAPDLRELYDSAKGFSTLESWMGPLSKRVMELIERVSKAEAENAFLKSQEAWKRIDSMSSTIDRMTLEIAQLAVTAKRVASADEENVALRAEKVEWEKRENELCSAGVAAWAENDALEAKLAKLEAPISDEEWGECDVPALAEFDALHRKLANAITAARGREPDPPVQP